MSRKLFTSESVTMGHPDKVCDRISDAVLDEVMRKDPNGRVACEVCCTTGMVLVMGEISTEAYVDIAGIARKTLLEIGYDGPEAGFDGNTCAVILSIDEQSPDIAMGTKDEIGGAGDQGMMFGYACDETKDLMPLPITLANRMAYKLTQVRWSNALPFILPDGKTQVTVEYDENDRPARIDTVVVSTQHKDGVTKDAIEAGLMEYVIGPTLKEAQKENPNLVTEGCKVFINPTGRFVKGGPSADSGLTGRKIIVDTYGGYGAHGGGAFSGKDPTKVDRSAAYAARYIAKNIVGAGLARKCQVQLAYAIGVAEPVSIRVDTFGTGKVDDEIIAQRIEQVYDLTPAGIINRLKLRRPVYKGTSAYGHFGNVIHSDRTWERLDMVDAFEILLLH